MIVDRAAQQCIQLRGFRKLVQLGPVPCLGGQGDALGLREKAGPDALQKAHGGPDLLVAHNLPYDAALAGLDLAVIRIQHREFRDVMLLAKRMKKVFDSFGIEREAISAMLVFYEAARQEQATVDLARQTASIIERINRATKSPVGAQA